MKKILFILLLAIGELMSQDFSKLNSYIDNLATQFDKIPNERKELLLELTNYIKAERENNNSIKLTFICTHNSRRSHLSQIWAQKAAEYYQVDNVECYSGGTEETAFNYRAVKALQKNGFIIEKQDESENPVYLVKYANEKEPLKAFSKKFIDKFNPQENFCAIMTCNHADENCPIVLGAKDRIPISYDDPKDFDGTELEEQKYDERSEEIAREMLFVFSNVK